LNRAWDGTVQVDCRPESCRFATNYYEKLKNHDALGRFEALPEPMQVRVWAEGMEVCPHALALDRIEEVDVIIGDFNHVFDPDAEVRRLEPDKLVLVVDEAHQLPERVMEAASPVLPLALVDAVLQHYSDPQHEALRVLALQVATEIRDAPLRAITIDGVAAGNEQEVVVEAPLKRWQGVRDAMDEVGWDHLKLRTEFGVDPWLELARAVFRFVRTLEQAGEETVAIAGIGGEPTVEELAEGALVVAGQHLRLCCRDPARLLAPRFAAFVATIQLSATLHPVGFHQDRCGLAPERVLQFEATPFFPPQNRLVLTVPGVSTAWKHRDRDRDAVAAIVEQTVMSIVGNVAVFFTSYQQMRDVGNALVLPGKVLLKQEPGLAEEDRRRIISAVKEGTDRVLLAVLGGIFAEGVDIPEGLVGVVVVGPGFPPPTLDRKLQQKWLEDVYGDGFERAFVLPGMTRVVQASGRVIRSEHDKGVVVLVCQRFGQSQLRAYLPKDWLVEKSKKPWEEIKVFFEGEPEPPEGAMVLRAIRSRAMVGEVEVGEVEVGKKRRRKVKEVGMPQLGLFRTAKRAEDAEDAEGKTEGERT
jgi:Rad3-related DNA helicase